MDQDVRGGRRSYECAKCGSRTFTQGQLRGTGGFISKLLDIQTRKFTTLTCSGCGYTELYAARSSMAGNVLDFFTSG